MKKSLLIILMLFTTIAFSQVKTFGTQIKLKKTPNLGTVDSLLTKNSNDVISATAFTDLKTQLGLNVYLKNINEDLTPQLGGNLDLNNFDITGIGNVNNTGNITSTGTLQSLNASITNNLTVSNDITFSNYQNTRVDASAINFLHTDASGNLLSSPITSIVYEENLKSVSTNSIPTGIYELPIGFKNQLNAQVIYNGKDFLLNYYDIDFTNDGTHTKYYVNYQTGSDSNSGLTSFLAVKSLNKAIDLVQALLAPAEIIIEDEWIGYQSYTSSEESFDYDIKIRSGSPSGKTTITQKRESYEGAFGWVNNGDGSFTSTTNSYNHSVMYDNKYKDFWGGAKPMKAVGSLAEVVSTKGSFWWDGAAINVQMWDSREPDGDWIYAGSGLTASKLRILQTKTDGVVILENLITYSNNKTSSSDGFSGRCESYTGVNPNTAKLGVKGCLAYGSSGNGFAFTDYSVMVFDNCYARYNRKDGFNYHSLAGLTDGNYITVYETRCKSFNQGFDGFFINQPVLSVSNNGSSAHDNINILRVNCVHSEGNGPIIADVGGCDSLNYGVTANYPNMNTESITNSSFYYLADTGTSPQRMYIIGCSSDDSTKGTGTPYTISLDGITGEIIVDKWQGEKNVTLNGVIRDIDGVQIN